MKRRIIIISTSLFVLALIVGMGFYAQSRNESKNNIATELTDKNIPENCKKCPEVTKCFDEQGKTTADCTGKCEKADCAKCDKKSSCTKSASCETKKSEASTCPAATTCEKSCEKKKN